MTTWPAAPQLHPVAIPDTNVNCEARVSVTVMVAAVDEFPRFLTAILKVPFAPAMKVPVCDFVMETSGPPNVTESVAELLPELLSPNVATVAVLLIVPDADASTATIKGIDVADAPGASGPGFVHVTTCETAPHVQPAALPDTNVK